MIRYDNIFDQAIERLHSEGRYRVFIDILRNKGMFPNARCFAGHNGPKPITVWCSNDYLAMGQRLVKQHQQGVALAAAKSEVRVARKPILAGAAVEHHVVDAGQHAVDQAVPQGADPGPVGVQALDRDARCGSHGHHPRDIRCARTHVTFLTTTVQQRHAGDIPAQQ